MIACGVVRSGYGVCITVHFRAPLIPHEKFRADVLFKFCFFTQRRRISGANPAAFQTTVHESQLLSELQTNCQLAYTLPTLRELRQNVAHCNRPPSVVTCPGPRPADGMMMILLWGPGRAEICRGTGHGKCPP